MIIILNNYLLCEHNNNDCHHLHKIQWTQQFKFKHLQFHMQRNIDFVNTLFNNKQG